MCFTGNFFFVVVVGIFKIKHYKSDNRSVCNELDYLDCHSQSSFSSGMWLVCLFGIFLFFCVS